MNTLTTEEIKRIRGMEENALIAAVGEAITKISRDIAWLAAAVQDLANRQHDRTGHICRSGYWAYLPLIASGRVSPRAWATFLGREDLMKLVSQLTIEEQERICADGASFEVVEKNPLYGKVVGQPEFDTRKYLPYLLPDGLVGQVFSTGQTSPGKPSSPSVIRNDGEQIAFIKSKDLAPRKPHKERLPTIKTDSEHLLVYVDGKPIRFAVMVDAIAQIVSERPDTAKTVRDAIRRLSTVTAR